MLYMDALASFWRDWIVNYDVAHQLRLTENASRGSRGIVARAQAWARSRYERMLAWARRTQARLGQSGVRLGIWALAAFVVALFLFSVPRLVSITRRFQLVRKPQAAPQLAATIWYQKMLRQTARQGWHKAPEQTPAEFVSAIADAELQSQVSAFTKHYQKARFGGSAQEVLELPRIYAEISKRRPVA